MSSVPQSCRTLSNCTPVHQAKITCSSIPQLKCCLGRHTFPVLHSPGASFNGHCVSRRGHAIVACSDRESDSGNKEPTSLETVQKLYKAMRNRSVHEISDILAEECLCISNFFSTFQPFHGKKQVLDFFSCLMKKMGNNIEFVVQNTAEHGIVVAVSWKLEWNKVPLPLGKGFSFYMCHVYMGKVMIKNVEIFLEPLLHSNNLRLKFMSLVMRIMEKLSIWGVPLRYKRRLRAREIMFILLFMLAIVFLLRYWFCK